MALIERLMGLEEPKIRVHPFYAANHEVIEGHLSTAQVKSNLQMDAAAAAEYDALAALAPTGTNATALALKSLYVSRLHAVFVLAEEGVPGYDTPQAVRTKLGI